MTFANYDQKIGPGQTPYGGKANTVVLEMTEAFEPMQSWTLPNEVLDRFEDMSNSGGSWGPDGFLYLSAHDPAEVYILDIGLPGMSGHELARRLRVHPRASHSVLLALSGYGRASDREASREAGFEVHFVKPVDPDHLLRVLQRVASRPVRST